MSGYSEHFEDDAEQEAALQREAARLLQAQERDDFLWLMNAKQGRRVMWSLLEKTGLFREPFVPGSPDKTLHNLGVASVGRQYLADIMRECPDKYLLMTKERQEHVRKHQRQRRADGSTDERSD
jgi:hypothetical protein